MQSMIITIRNKSNTFQYDIEVPSDIDGYKLMTDLTEGLANIRPDIDCSPDYHGLYIDRLGRFLGKNETLSEAGVRNGDFGTLKSKEP